MISASFAVLLRSLEIRSIRPASTARLSLNSLRTRSFSVSSSGLSTTLSDSLPVAASDLAPPGNRAPMDGGKVSPRLDHWGASPAAILSACPPIASMASEVNSDGCCCRRCFMAGKIASDIWTISATLSKESMLSSSNVLISASICQAKSPTSSAPTMRPLPLSVWKPRRISVNGAVFSGCFTHSGIRPASMSATDSYSSRNTSSSSGSSVAGPEALPVSEAWLSLAGAFAVGVEVTLTASISPTGK